MLEGTATGRNLFARLLAPRFGRVITAETSAVALGLLETVGPFDVAVVDLEADAEAAALLGRIHLLAEAHAPPCSH